MSELNSDDDKTPRLPAPGTQRLGTSVTRLSPSGESPKTLVQEGLTSLQQLHKSGELLLRQMEQSLDSSAETGAGEVIEAAKALALTAQAKVVMVKALKDFTK